MYIIVLFKDGQHVSIEAASAESAREAVNAAHDAMNQRRAFKVGDSATFSSDDVKSVYISKKNDAEPTDVERSIFDMVFGRHR